MIGESKKVYCDYCEIVGLPEYPCRGQAVHCEHNRHCTMTMQECAIDNRHGDHPGKCCYCKKEMPGE